ncbi:MAG: hypothetical protein IH991_15720, partial [Planctomycetes bacterium]|nr:hypothetical protein [Planctomycetota bacterium]
MFRRVILVFACLVLSVTSTQADVVKKPNDKKKTDALDIIPKDVFAAIAIRNVAELTKRGDEFIHKTEMKVPMRLSDAYRFVIAHLGIANGLDEDAPAALLMFNPKFDEKSFVLAVPVADFQAMAANFGLKRDDLVAGKIIDREAKKDARSQPFMRYLSVRGDHLLMGGSPKSIEIAATGKSLREFLPDNDRKTLAQDDIVLFFNSQAINDEWDGILRSLNREFEGLAADERQALKQVAEATRELTYAAAGIRLDKGLGASVMLQFKGDRSREILTRLQGGEKIKTSLTALPLGRVLAA